MHHRRTNPFVITGTAVVAAAGLLLFAAGARARTATAPAPSPNKTLVDRLLKSSQ